MGSSKMFETLYNPFLKAEGALIEVFMTVYYL